MNIRILIVLIGFWNTVMIVDDLDYAFIASPGIGFDYRKMSFREDYKCEAGINF